MDSDAVVGKLVRLWSWAELNRIDPNDLGVTKDFIDKLVGRKGFAQALEKTGWLIETGEKLSFRNFKRHNSPVAQNKVLTAKRVARHRLRKAATQEKDTVKPLSDPAPDSPPETSETVNANQEKITEKPLPKTVVEAPTVDEVPDFEDNVSDVITQDSSLNTNEEKISDGDLESADSVTTTGETVMVIEQTEALPPITPQEALAVLQLEEPAPRKRRSKAAVETDDQPMLF